MTYRMFVSKADDATLMLRRNGFNGPPPRVGETVTIYGVGFDVSITVDEVTHQVTETDEGPVSIPLVEGAVEPLDFARLRDSGKWELSDIG